MNTRQIVAQEIRNRTARYKVGRRPKYKVISNPTNKLDPITPGHAVIVIIRDSFAPAPNLGSRIETISLWLMVPGLDLNKIEDVLDECALEVEGALDASPYLVWDDAERSVYQDTTHAYRFTVRTITTRGN